jgi:hypothetical protein
MNRSRRLPCSPQESEAGDTRPGVLIPFVSAHRFSDRRERGSGRR